MRVLLPWSEVKNTYVVIIVSTQSSDLTKSGYVDGAGEQPCLYRGVEGVRGEGLAVGRRGILISHSGNSVDNVPDGRSKKF